MATPFITMNISSTPPPERSLAIAQARREWIEGEPAGARGARIEPWVLRSWQRCLAAGHRPQHRVSFDPVPRQAIHRVAEQIGRAHV